MAAVVIVSPANVADPADPRALEPAGVLADSYRPAAMVIVTTADPLHDMWDADPWKYEGAINRLVGRFIKSLPKE
jgi:hypothetical protein